MRYNKTNYIYVRNAFGDVVMIVKDKKPVAKYFYDAHGNCQMETYNDTDGIGDLNPFRWRSHYYDAESGLYYANGSYYDPETGTHIDASEVSEIADNAFTCFALDRNGIMCNNILVYLPDFNSIATTLQMSADPTYDPDANKSELDKLWEDIIEGISKALATFFNWINDLDWRIKIAVGVILLVIAIVLTGVTHGVAAVVVTLLVEAVFCVTGSMLSFTMAANYGEATLTDLRNEFANGIFWAGIFAFVSAGVNYIKVKIRVRRAAKISQSSAINRAKELQKLPSNKRPTMTSAAVDINTGNIYYGDSGTISKNINSVLADRMPTRSLTNWKVANCAEFNAVNNALNAGVNMNNLVVTTVRVKTLMLEPMCFNCQVSLQGVLLVVSG